MTSRRILIGILALTAAVYLPGVFLHDFVSLDDLLLIVQNDKVHGLNPTNVMQVLRSYDPELYVPLTLMTYQLEYTLTGLHPYLYHFDNLLLHMGSVTLVFLLTRKIRAACHPQQSHHDMVALLVAALFALQPLQVEAVSWAAARKDLLSGFLVLLSMLLFLRSRETGSKDAYRWSTAVYVLALMSKVSVILIPFSILLFDVLRGNFRFKKGSIEFTPFAIAAVFFGIIAMFGKTLQLRQLTLPEQFLLGMKGLVFYIVKFFVPAGLTVYQPQLEPVTFASLEFLAATLVVGGFIVAAILLRRRAPLFTFGMALYALAVAPSFMNVWKKGNLYFASDRYAYIGIIGIALAAVTVLLPMLDRTTVRMRSVIGTLMLLAMTGGSFAQAQTWADSTSLYTRARKIHPEFAVAMNNLGAAQYQDGNKEEALASYEQAIASDPTLTSGYVNITLYWRKEGDPQKAMETIQAGLGKIPEGRPVFDEEVTAWNILGLLYDERGMREEALTAYRKAAKRAPESPDAHYNLGVTEQKYGLLPEAHDHLALYLTLKPRDLEARYRLAAVQAETGKLHDAMKNLQIILLEDSQYPNAAGHLERIKKLLKQ